MKLDGKIALITGAGSGIGAATARLMAAEGATVVLVGIPTAAIDAVARELSDAGHEPLTITADVADGQQMADAVGWTVGHFGRLDIVVANAGIVMAGAIEDFDVERWRKVVDVNLTGYFLCAKHAARIMKPQQRGSIIQINSKSGKKGSFKNGAYAASKFGGIGLTQSIALELAEFGVRVNAVCPGNLLDSPLWQESLYSQYAARLGISEAEVRQRYVDQVPMKRGCTYQDVTNVVVFLASDQSSYMTGQAINVTGGQEMR